LAIAGRTASARSAVARYGDALVIAQSLALGFGGGERGLGAGGDGVALVLGDGSEDVDGEFSGGGIVAADEIDLASISIGMNVRLRESRSSLAMTNFALCFLQAASARSSSGRSLRSPLSTSTNSSSSVHFPPSR
jgi:hypothetical protein